MTCSFTRTCTNWACWQRRCLRRRKQWQYALLTLGAVIWPPSFSFSIPMRCRMLQHFWYSEVSQTCLLNNAIWSLFIFLSFIFYQHDNHTKLHFPLVYYRVLHQCWLQNIGVTNFIRKTIGNLFKRTQKAEIAVECHSRKPIQKLLQTCIGKKYDSKTAKEPRSNIGSLEKNRPHQTLLWGQIWIQ